MTRTWGGMENDAIRPQGEFDQKYFSSIFIALPSTFATVKTDHKRKVELDNQNILTE